MWPTLTDRPTPNTCTSCTSRPPDHRPARPGRRGSHPRPAEPETGSDRALLRKPHNHSRPDRRKPSDVSDPARSTGAVQASTHAPPTTYKDQDRVARRLYGLLTTVRRQGLEPRTRGSREDTWSIDMISETVHLTPTAPIPSSRPYESVSDLTEWRDRTRGEPMARTDPSCSSDPGDGACWRHWWLPPPQSLFRPPRPRRRSPPVGRCGGIPPLSMWLRPQLVSPRTPDPPGTTTVTSFRAWKYGVRRRLVDRSQAVRRGGLTTGGALRYERR